MESPKRITRLHKKGFKLPENTVCVHRPSIYSSPFAAAYIEATHDTFGGYYRIVIRPKNESERLKLEQIVTAYPFSYGTKKEAQQAAVNCYRDLMNSGTHRIYDLEDLRGKNLADWCKEGTPCHIGVIFEVLYNH
jgi:hypothetical protein